MKIYGYDFEVMAHDWLCVFIEEKTETVTVAVNDALTVKELMDDPENVFVGFNCKGYDRFIMHGVLEDMTPEQIKGINDFIIKEGKPGWEYPFNSYLTMNNVDVFDDMQPASLKSIEGQLYYPIVESSIPFDYPDKLTDEQLKEMIDYCISDVKNTLRIFRLRKDYYANKIKVGQMAGLSVVESMSSTNAKLAAKMLKAKPQKRDDEFKLTYPTDLLTKYVPDEAFDFFNEAINDPDNYDPTEKSVEFNIGECECRIGWGGIHGAIPQYEFIEDDKTVLKDSDVGSFYPHIMTLKNKLSRNIPSYKVFQDVLDTRMEAKKAGDKATANALKLVVNSTFGASGDKYNDLYDPLMFRSVCMYGQLYLVELACNLYKNIPNLTIVQLNTDGIMYEYNREYESKVEAILKEWQDRTGFTLETDSISKFFQKDVNNYIWVEPDGEIKTKGGELVRGIAPAGAFKVNNDAICVANAIIDYFVKGISPEDSINADNDIKHFQFIARASSKYDGMVYMYDGKEVPTQKCNRVYATADEKCGTLLKTKGETRIKVASIPEHCLIDNDNHCAITDVDKTFYIRMANTKIQAFRKEFTIMDAVKEAEKKPVKKASVKAVDCKPFNVYQKLNLVRSKILDGSVKQSGKNRAVGYEYFELADFVPQVTNLFNEVGLISVVTYSEDLAIMTVVNTDKPEEQIVFSSPMRYPTENRGINPVQALGGAHTYLRRYLYYMALDLVVVDEIEPTTVSNKPTVEVSNKVPPTPVKRAEIVKENTDSDGPADALLIGGLKGWVKKLVQSDDADLKKFGAEVSLKTAKFTKEISKKACEALIKACKDKYGEKFGYEVEG